MKYHFIEVGTSDFRTLSNEKGMKGISIEPVKAYFDNLIDREHLTKINAAISDEAGIGKMYYCKPDVIDYHGLPQWLKGCNSLNQPHPSVLGWCEKTGIEYGNIVAEEPCPLITLESVFENHNVTEVDFLKIDTEGHDAVIMEHFLNIENPPTIKRIQFESNSLMKPKDWEKIINLAISKGYSYHNINERGNQDTILTLR